MGNAIQNMDDWDAFDEDVRTGKPLDVADDKQLWDNPKHIQAMKEGKAPMHLIPWRVLEEVAWVLYHGAEKYGERNWRVDKIKASTYEASLFRHIYLEWAQGEDVDGDSGKHPLSHAIATLLLMMDAMMEGTFIDDRDRKESKDGSTIQGNDTRPE